MNFSLSPECPRWTWHLRHFAASIADGRYLSCLFTFVQVHMMYTLLLFSLGVTGIQFCSVYLTALLLYQVEQRRACKRRYMQLMYVWFMFIQTCLSSKLTWLAAGFKSTMQSKCMTSFFSPSNAWICSSFFGGRDLAAHFFNRNKSKTTVRTM